jgi:hypothetical protein
LALTSQRISIPVFVWQIYGIQDSMRYDTLSHFNSSGETKIQDYYIISSSSSSSSSGGGGNISVCA